MSFSDAFATVGARIDRLVGAGEDGQDEVHKTVEINGQRVPVVHVNYPEDGDLIISIDVATAVEHGFDFARIYRHVAVDIGLHGEEFRATVGHCEIEHGIAGLRVTPDPEDVDVDELAEQKGAR